MYGSRAQTAMTIAAIALAIAQLDQGAPHHYAVFGKQFVPLLLLQAGILLMGGTLISVALWYNAERDNKERNITIGAIEAGSALFIVAWLGQFGEFMR